MKTFTFIVSILLFRKRYSEGIKDASGIKDPWWVPGYGNFATRNAKRVIA